MAIATTTLDEEIRKLQYLAELLPAIGSEWIWMPHQYCNRSLQIVEDVKWNGEEWWVISKDKDSKEDDERHYNELSRWYEATVMA